MYVKYHQSVANTFREKKESTYLLSSQWTSVFVIKHKTLFEKRLHSQIIK